MEAFELDRWTIIMRRSKAGGRGKETCSTPSSPFSMPAHQLIQGRGNLVGQEQIDVEGLGRRP